MPLADSPRNLTRTCDDKKGLEAGRFVRIAARNRPENAYIVRSFAG